MDGHIEQYNNGNREKSLSFYNDVKDKLGKKIVLTPTIYKRQYFEDDWTYDFIFYKDKLKKIEAYNRRELIESYV